MSGRRPVALVALGILGLAISVYLTAFQVGVVHGVWDPFFGDGSARVLTSSISRLLPVPDASLGAGAYLVDAVLAVALTLRLGPQPLVALVLAAVSSLAALVAIGLAILQPIVVGAVCSLCLTSALISVGLAIGAVAEARDQARTTEPASTSRRTSSHNASSHNATNHNATSRR